jgi:hypothetical protein
MRSDAEPTGRPAGTYTASRRTPLRASTVVTLVATVVIAADADENVIALLAAVALNPVPVMLMDTPADAPAGVNAVTAPARTVTVSGSQYAAAMTSQIARPTRER